MKVDIEPKVHEFLEKVVPLVNEAKDVSEPYRTELVEQINALADETRYKGKLGLKKAKKVFRNIKRG